MSDPSLKTWYDNTQRALECNKVHNNNQGDIMGNLLSKAEKYESLKGDEAPFPHSVCDIVADEMQTKFKEEIRTCVCAFYRWRLSEIDNAAEELRKANIDVEGYRNTAKLEVVSMSYSYGNALHREMKGLPPLQEDSVRSMLDQLSQSPGMKTCIHKTSTN
ncbi:hypothetical protein CC2G_011133 [Coprinopsis cinerea AmutBmut pab1-1]|nr:hypothetical protein CC2G_011133 [Coprinopsis cinerea AmutBmut pab1-1]